MRSANPRPQDQHGQMADALPEQDANDAPTLAYSGRHSAPPAPGRYTALPPALRPTTDLDEYEDFDTLGSEWTEAHMLALPFPQWLTLGAPIALLLTLVVVYVLETALLGGDWATGALAVSVTAFALAVVSLGVIIARVALGRRSFSSIFLAGLLMLFLVGSGLAGITQANPLRMAQAGQAERAGNWDLAVNEYTQAGEHSPNSANLARVYVEWGEALMRRGDYAGASAKLTSVTQRYAQSGADVARARADLFKSYGLWIKSGAITLPFKQSLDFLATYSKDSACDTACKKSIVDLTGQAHYQYGEQLVKAKQYKPAITEFELVLSQYASSTFDGPAYKAAATTYWALGQQLLTQDCVSAVPYYQILQSRYSDLPEGHQAAAALSAPQTVRGVMTGLPTNPTPTLYLSKTINTNANIYSHDFKATLDPATGKYTFSNVDQGTYYLTTYRSISSTQESFTYYKDTNTGQPYSFQVGPLCATDLGSMGY
jgi:tetratricopeptide (TPR) repeat protein